MNILIISILCIIFLPCLLGLLGFTLDLMNTAFEKTILNK